MTNKAFTRFREKSTRERFKLCDKKMIEYTRGNLKDRLCNFKRIGELLDIDPLKVLAVYLFKHMDGIAQFIKTGKGGTEKIKYRIHDAQNYLDLAGAMIFEKSSKKRLTFLKKFRMFLRTKG